MGAYFECTIEKDGEITRYNTWSINKGSKLMEHSYIGNEYVERCLSLLENKPGRLTWLCDYHEEPNMTWDHITEKDIDIKETWEMQPFYRILNHTKELQIDMKKLVLAYKDRSLLIHPLPILCNSDTEPQGGGDFRKDESRRAIWKGDEIEIVFDDTSSMDYRDVSMDCLFCE
jgi:hypothetical protein